MYVSVRTKKLKKCGAIYKEEVITTRYLQPRKVVQTATMLFVTHLEEVGFDGAGAVETTTAIHKNDLVGMEIYE